MSSDDEATRRDQELSRIGLQRSEVGKQQDTLRASLEQSSAKIDPTNRGAQWIPPETLTAEMISKAKRTALGASMTGQSVQPRSPELVANAATGGRSVRVHRIKSQSPHFEDLRSLRKKAELRKADRDYQPGDYLVLNHFQPTPGFDKQGIYTGDGQLRVITHVMPVGYLDQPTQENYVMISVDMIPNSDSMLDYLLKNPEPEEIILERRKRAGIAPSHNSTLAKHPPLTLHERELIIHLIQEANEVGKAATKLLLFGMTAVDPHTGKSWFNSSKLGIECGNMQHMIHVCQAASLIDDTAIRSGERDKQEGLRKYLTKETGK